MTKPKLSKVQISQLSLTRLNFEKKSDKLGRKTIPTHSISFEVNVKQITETECLTICKIDTFSKKEPPTNFIISMEYEVHSNVLDKTDVKELIAFARLGAPFNVFVHARELIIQLTLKAFGKAAFFPLLNISDLQKETNVKVELLPGPETGTVTSTTEGKPAE